MPHPRARSVLPLLVLWLLVCGCTAAADDATDPDPQDAGRPTAAAAGSAPPVAVEGGAVVFGITAEPVVLNPWLPDASPVSALVSRPVLASLWRILPDGTYEPWLLEGEPDVQAAQADTPFAVTYRIRQDATWSDGAAIDGADVLFTLALCQDSRLGLQPVSDCEAVDVERSTADGKQVTVVFDRTYPAWRTVLSRLPVLPAHALAGRDPASLWTRRLTLSSGPFRFSSWTPGRHIVLERNERWWGAPPPLERIVFRLDSQSPVHAIASGAIEVAEAPATPDTLERARASTGVRAEVQPGPWWEALDFNFDTPLLRRDEIRRALVQALDRQTMVAELLKPVAPSAQVRDDVGLTADAPPEAVPRYPRFDPPAAMRALAGAGCAKRNDGVLTCAGQRMELDLVVAPPNGSAASTHSVPPDWQHTLVGEYVRSQLAHVGVQVNLMDSVDEAAAPAEDDRAWDLRVTAVPRAPHPALASRRWRCGDDTNTQAFCDPALEALTARADGALDPAERTAAYADAALLLARELPTYPLFDIPALLLRRSDGVQGPVLNSGPWGATWNTEEWARTER